MIVFPMAGLSSRFTNAGYRVPKYELPISGSTVFEKAVLSFKNYFNEQEFLFITRKELKSVCFIESKLVNLGVKNFKILELYSETLGQADTVYQGVNQLSDYELLIFNIDTFLINFEFPVWLKNCEGYLEVFNAEGSNWSFIEAGKNNNVLRTTEKDRISDLCSNGIYYFKSAKKFCKLVEHAYKSEDFTKGELYIAPLYNYLIRDGLPVLYKQVPSKNVIICGTPAEYEALLRSTSA